MRQRPFTTATPSRPGSSVLCPSAPAGIAVILAAVLALRTAAPAQDTPTPPAADIALATYNINYGNPDLRAVTQSILKSKADVVALQETNRQSEAYLRKELTKTYPHMVFHRASGGGGFAMLSKVPLEKSRYLPPLPANGGWFGTQMARVMLGGRELLIVNTHLMATVPPENMDPSALPALFARTEAVRDKEIRYIVAQLPKRWPVVVLGDFNSIPKVSGVPDFMTRSGFTDCLAAVVETADEVATWHWRRGGVEYRVRLDYIFSARTSAIPVSGEVVRGDGSDHFLVSCSFKWLPIPVGVGRASTQAAHVVYLLDAGEMTPERFRTARELLTASMTGLTPVQCLCTIVPGRGDPVVPPELSPATEENRTLAADGLPKEPPKAAALLPAVARAMSLLADEAAPKVLFILSDQLARDPLLLKSVRALHTDKRLQLLLLDAEGKPIADAGADAAGERKAFPAIPRGLSPERTE